MLFGPPEADDADCVVIGAFGEDHHMQASIDHSDGDKAQLAVIEAVVLAFERGFPLEAGRGLQRNAVLDPVARILGRVKLDIHRFNVHPLKPDCKRAVLRVILTRCRLAPSRPKA